MRRLASPSFPGLAASALSGAVAVWYLVLIARGVVYTRDAEVYVAIVALVLFGQAAVSLAGALWRSFPLLVLAAVLLTVTGVLALFSIGAPLLLAALLEIVAAAWTRCARGAEWSPSRTTVPRGGRRTLAGRPTMLT